MRQSKKTTLFYLFIIIFILSFITIGVSVAYKMDEIKSTNSMNLRVLSFYNKAFFEKLFIDNIKKDKVKIINVDMNKSLFLGPEHINKYLGAIYTRKFNINNMDIPSYINYKVENVFGDKYISVASNPLEGNNCFHIANTKNQLYIWQQPEFAIITEESAISDKVFHKPYCFSLVLPKNSKIEVKTGQYGMTRYGAMPFSIKDVLLKQ